MTIFLIVLLLGSMNVLNTDSLSHSIETIIGLAMVLELTIEYFFIFRRDKHRVDKNEH